MVVGGTFDEFHRGHQALLEKAFEVGDQVMIGLSSDSFAQRIKKNHGVARYKTRLEELKSFLREKGVLNRAEIVPLNDPYGVTLSEGCAEALVVSRETEPRAHAINKRRQTKGLPPLHLIVIEMVAAENHTPISTTRIKQRKIDREGHLLNP